MTTAPKPSSQVASRVASILVLLGGLLKVGAAITGAVVGVSSISWKRSSAGQVESALHFTIIVVFMIVVALCGLFDLVVGGTSLARGAAGQVGRVLGILSAVAGMLIYGAATLFAALLLDGTATYVIALLVAATGVVVNVFLLVTFIYALSRGGQAAAR